MSKSSEKSLTVAESDNRDVEYQCTKSDNGVHLENDRYTYTDPNSNEQYIWSEEKSEWVAKDATQTQTSLGGYNNYEFDGEKYFYTESETNKRYMWDSALNTWVCEEPNAESVKNKGEAAEEEEEDDNCGEGKKIPNKQDMSKGRYSYDEDTPLYIDNSDGTVYFWDKEKNAWFPKIDDTFMAYYQMNYGFGENADSQSQNKETIHDVVKSKDTSSNYKKEVTKEPTKEVSQPQKRKANMQEPGWFEIDEERNTHVYVSNLPLDITEQEFVDLMQKCGLVMKDVQTGKMKVKLYSEPDGKHLKGDALCTYIKRESVDLALQLLDGYEYRGKKVKVELAHFTMKGEAYNPSLKPKKKKKKEKEKMKKMQEKLFDWRPDKLRGERAKHECVVVIKNLFDPKQLEDNLGLILEYRNDLTEECAKCGDVKKVVIHDKHAEGVAQVWFKEPEAADACVQLINGRWFEKRQLEAFTWDGKTKYKIEETKEETEARLRKWEKFISESGKEKESTDDKSSDGGDNETTSEDASKCEVPVPEKEEQNNDNVESDTESDITRSSAGSDDETGDEETK